MFSKYRAWLAAIILVGVGSIICATHGVWANPDHDTAVKLKKERVHNQTAADNFLIGLGYTTRNLASTFADIGAPQAKLNYGMSSWGEIEPDPPVNGNHIYDWDDLDNMIFEYQDNGFSEVHLTLKAKSIWGTEGCTIDNCAPYLPRPEHWSDYEAYVAAVVERYDKDGFHDMPDLRYPVRQYEIETEADALWPNRCMDDPQDPDRAATYLQLLPASSSIITVTHVITQTGQTEPVVELIEATERIMLTVSESPIFVEGVAGSSQEIFLPIIVKE